MKAFSSLPRPDQKPFRFVFVSGFVVVRDPNATVWFFGEGRKVAVCTLLYLAHVLSLYSSSGLLPCHLHWGDFHAEEDEGTQRDLIRSDLIPVKHDLTHPPPRASQKRTSSPSHIPTPDSNLSSRAQHSYYQNQNQNSGCRTCLWVSYLR